MATRVLHGIKFFEQFLKVTTKGTFLWSLDEIGSVAYEEMSFKVKVYGRTPDEKRSQKLTLSLSDRWDKKWVKDRKGRVAYVYKISWGCDVT
jgi:hypothetical protein